MNLGSIMGLKSDTARTLLVGVWAALSGMGVGCATPVTIPEPPSIDAPAEERITWAQQWSLSSVSDTTGDRLGNTERVYLTSTLASTFPKNAQLAAEAEKATTIENNIQLGQVIGLSGVAAYLTATTILNADQQVTLFSERARQTTNLVFPLMALCGLVTACGGLGYAWIE